MAAVPATPTSSSLPAAAQTRRDRPSGVRMDLARETAEKQEMAS